MNNDKLFAKIKKLLALSKSSNPHEAAKALELAQRLMQEHQISQEEVLVSEKSSGNHFAKKSPLYIHQLATLIERCFGVKAVFAIQLSNEWTLKATAKFFGEQERPVIAAYCFDVLFRQIKQARKAFINEQSKRLKRSTLIARADAFCSGWVTGVAENVREFALTEQEKTNLEHYVQQKLKVTQGKAREIGNTREQHYGEDSASRGYRAGRKVKLNHGVNGKEQGKLTVSTSHQTATGGN